MEVFQKMTRRLLPGDCLIASNVFKDLSVNKNIDMARRRLNMQIVNQRRLGKKQSAFFFKGLLKTLKNNKLKGRDLL